MPRTDERNMRPVTARMMGAGYGCRRIDDDVFGRIFAVFRPDGSRVEPGAMWRSSRAAWYWAANVEGYRDGL